MKSEHLGKKFLKLPGRSGSSKSILSTGDNHVGSYFAVASQHPILSDGTEIKPTKIMSVLDSAWFDVLDSLEDMRQMDLDTFETMYGYEEVTQNMSKQEKNFSS